MTFKRYKYLRGRKRNLKRKNQQTMLSARSSSRKSLNSRLGSMMRLGNARFLGSDNRVGPAAPLSRLN